MAGETVITVIGNLTNDPELRFTPSGAAVANFTIASTPRTLDRQSNEWKDGETLFISCAVWRQVAENVAESLTRGSRVVVTGRLKARSYDDRDGNKRTVFECDVEEIGASMRYATLKISKTSRSDGGGGGFGGGGGAASSSVAAATREVATRAAATAAVRVAASRTTPGQPRKAAAVSPPRRTTPGPARAAARWRSPRSDRPANPLGTIPALVPGSGNRKRAPQWPRSFGSRRRRSAASARTRRRTSITRTPRCCASSSRTAARSAPAG